MNLLSGVRNDIEYGYQNLPHGGRADNHPFSAHKSSAADMLLAERGRIDSSHQMTDEILECVHSHSVDESDPTNLRSRHPDKRTKPGRTFPGNEALSRALTPGWQEFSAPCLA